MKDLQARREKLLVDAADCELICNLAPDAGKRATFRRLARQLRQMADYIDAEIAAREGGVAA
jgi:hypothetical protein